MADSVGNKPVSGDRRAPGASAQGGSADDIDSDLPVVRQLQGQAGGRNPLIGVVGGIVGWLLSRLVPGGGIMFVGLAVPFGIGLLVGSRLLRSRPKGRAIAVWSGLVTWAVPFIGMFTAGAALAAQDPTRPSLRDRILAVITLVLSIGHGIIGALAQRHGA